MISNTNSSTNAVISGIDYAVNDIGQRTGITRSGSATPASASAAYAYNNRGELTAADEATNAMDRSFQYDGIGNREKSANSLTLPGTNNYTVNALNQYTAVNLGTSVSPVHDDDGNATAYPLPVNPAANATLTYDGENRLIKVITGSTTVEYIYDAFSRRVAKTVGSTRTYYIYNGWNCVAEYTGAVHTTGSAPALTRTYTHTWGLDLSGSQQGAGGVGGLLMSSKFTNNSVTNNFYPLYDGNGNITAYINSSCTVEASFDYDPFGNIANSNITPALPYAFSTKPREAETGLYYYGYRWYDPLTGRWINRDPIEESGGLNLYGFVGNDSINITDYLGLKEVSPAEYFANYLKQFKNGDLTQDQIQKLQAQFNGGCVGITCINLGHYGEIEREMISNCYLAVSGKFADIEAAFAKAVAKRDQMIKENKCKDCNPLPYNEESKPRIFSIRLWSNNKKYYIHSQTGAVRLDGWQKQKGKPTPDGKSFMIPYDFGFYNEESNSWTHANRGGQGMKVKNSTLKEFSVSLENFDKQVFCVACENWKY